MIRANTLLDDGVELIAHKNNSDGKGNSYGCHENYLVDRNVPFGRLAHSVMAHFVSRQIFVAPEKSALKHNVKGSRGFHFKFRSGLISSRKKLDWRQLFDDRLSIHAMSLTATQRDGAGFM